MYMFTRTWESNTNIDLENVEGRRNQEGRRTKDRRKEDGKKKDHREKMENNLNQNAAECHACAMCAICVARHMRHMRHSSCQRHAPWRAMPCAMSHMHATPRRAAAPRRRAGAGAAVRTPFLAAVLCASGTS